MKSQFGAAVGVSTKSCAKFGGLQRSLLVLLLLIIIAFVKLDKT